MKQIIAILREEQVENTKQSLIATGVPGVTLLYVTGRGQQKGKVSARELGESLSRNMRMQIENAPSCNDSTDAGTGMTGSQVHPDTEFAFGFLPKRMLIIVAYDEDVSRIVQAIVNVNQTGRHGDGRIFICPMISAMRVRTGELGDKALS
ncbi:P-II family nitrogen regulator [uncultured Methanoregula sp.]|uniref:P-II family nitrogen regulator n=1 Tax=uncultured Methanoregula sp. TaxID=1005933 RepID=UPI002AAB7CC9|nr:P-II family nitrogen regulator [uncultured Methanoregula sp.]